MSKFKRYIGRPYEECNCFDLVKEFYMEFFELDLNHYFNGPVVPDKMEIESLIVSGKGDFVKVDGEPEFGDIVVIKMFGIECHIGVVAFGGSFIHSVRKTGSVAEKLSKYKNMIAGFYRHRQNRNFEI